MICAVCDFETPALTHFWFEGDPARPVRRWTVEAPLYYVAAGDFLSATAPLCGAACATERRRQEEDSACRGSA